MQSTYISITVGLGALSDFKGNWRQSLIHINSGVLFAPELIGDRFIGFSDEEQNSDFYLSSYLVCLLDFPQKAEYIEKEGGHLGKTRGLTGDSFGVIRSI